MEIFKYELLPSDRQEIWMPEGAEPLTVQMQLLTPFIWAKVDPEAPLVLYEFITQPTGHCALPEDADKYLGTIQMGGGKSVFHIFTVKV